MATEEQLIEQTQNTLGKLITKPKMTEKYLKKPPFRFLHDIVMEVTRSTGFGQGLFSTEESDAANLSDKQAKVDFLNKAIDVVCFSLNDKVDVSAGKIVAGLEADKTNMWLQKLHEAATTCAGARSDEAVARIQNGETMAPTKEKKKKKEVEAPPADAAPAADDGGAAAAAAEEEAKKEEDKRRRAEKKKREEEKRRKAEEEAAAAKAAEEAAAAPPSVAASPETAPAEDAEEEQRKREKREEERRKKEEDRRRREEKKRQQAEEEERRRQAEEAAAAAQAQAQAQAAYAAAEAPAEEQGFPEQAPSAPGSAAQPNRPGAGEVGATSEEIAARAEQLLQQQQQGAGEEEGMGMGRPQRSERPRTAGRKPPKVVSKVQTSSDQPVTQGPVAPTILAEGAANDDDDNTFEAPQEVAVVAGGNLGATDDGGLQGKLVRDLEAQKKKEEEKERERIKKEEEESREEFDDQQGKGIKMGKLKRKKEQSAAAAEVDTIKLGESIQQLCQAANPLGKSIDLVHQDIANMGKELDHWKQEYRDASERYQQELKMTDETLQPLYQKVAELDDKIAEQKTRIRNSRSRISKNDIKIQSLLESVVLAK